VPTRRRETRTVTPDQKVQQIQLFAQQFLALHNKTTDASLKAECLKWINNAFGVTRGYAHEMNLAAAALLKKRELVLQTGGDVVCGKNADLFFKATEAKSVSTDIAADVDAVLLTAMNQLCGFGRNGGKVTPAPVGAARVIDVVLTSDKNVYPFYHEVGRNSAWQLEALVACMEKRLAEKIGQCPPMFNWLTGASVGADDVKRPTGLTNSTRLLTKGDKPLRVLTVKLRYNPAYELCAVGLGKKQVYLEEMVAQAFQIESNGVGELPVFVSKLKYAVPNGTGGFDGVRRFTQIDPKDSGYDPWAKSPAQAVIDG
jgi:hypothetical protein